MSKAKLFLENFIIYGLGGVISRIIPLIMIPIITRLMPNVEYYGISDMANTIVSFFSSIAVFGMYDAMFRLFFEKDEEEYKKRICSSSLYITLVTSIIVFFIMIIGRKAISDFFLSSNKYDYLIYIIAISTLVGATNSIISAPTRMQNKKGVFLVTNTLGPILSYVVAIPMLMRGYYVVALPLAGVISAVTMEISFAIMNRNWFSYKYFDVDLLKPLAKIAIPLFPNFLVYWVFNSCDRIMITQIIGIGASGKYAVGSKLGLASQLIYTAFAGGWQYFAFSTMNEENQVENNSKIFEYLGSISFAATMFICALARPIYEVLFTSDYNGVFIISPYLFLAPLLLMLYQIEANQFIVIKKTWPNMLILSIGALANIGFNVILIPLIGIEGAAIATLLGYFISLVVCSFVLLYMGLVIFSKRFLVITFMTIVCFTAWRIFLVNNTFMMLVVSFIFLIFCFVLYYSDIRKLLKAINKNNC